MKAALGIEEVLTGATDSHLHLTVADVIESFDTVDRGILDRVLSTIPPETNSNDFGCFGN